MSKWIVVKQMYHQHWTTSSESGLSWLRILYVISMTLDNFCGVSSTFPARCKQVLAISYMKRATSQPIVGVQSCTHETIMAFKRLARVKPVEKHQRCSYSELWPVRSECNDQPGVRHASQLSTYIAGLKRCPAASKKKLIFLL